MRRPTVPEAALVLWYGVGLLVAIGLKWFASRAGADALNWILAPTAWLASITSGADFEREIHAGWISHGHRMIVGPSCSGLNFMIIAFSTFFFSFIHAFRGAARRWAWLGATLAGSYLLTVSTNALRIASAIHLYQSDIYGHLVTHERVHRLTGVVIYCLSLLLSYVAVDRCFSALRARSALVPLGWYLTFVIGVPLANRAYVSQPRLFLEHSAVVIMVCALLAAAARYLPRYRRC